MPALSSPAFGLGGIIYSLSLPFLVVRLTERQLMLTGAALARIAFILISLNMAWYVQAAVFVLFGLGFYMLHNCIQVHVTDLSQTARGTALSMHSSAFFFRPGDRADLLRLRLRPFRHRRAAVARRRRHCGHRPGLRAVAAASAPAPALGKGANPPHSRPTLHTRTWKSDSIAERRNLLDRVS